MDNSYYYKYKKYKNKYYNLKGGVDTNIIKINCNDIHIFNQVYNLCWFHSSISLLFFSDITRDIVWKQCFYLQKMDKFYLPIRASLFNPTQNKYFYVSFFWYLILEIIRNSLYTLIKNKSEIKNIKYKKKFKSCDKILQDIIYKIVLQCTELKNIQTEGGGSSFFFIDRFLAWYNLYKFFNFSKLYTRTDKEKKHIFNFNLKSRNIGLLFEDGYHIISIFKCNSKWVLYDNEKELFIFEHSNKIEKIEDIFDYLIKSQKINKISNNNLFNTSYGNHWKNNIKNVTIIERITRNKREIKSIKPSISNNYNNNLFINFLYNIDNVKEETKRQYFYKLFFKLLLENTNLIRIFNEESIYSDNNKKNLKLLMNKIKGNIKESKINVSINVNDYIKLIKLNI